MRARRKEHLLTAGLFLLLVLFYYWRLITPELADRAVLVDSDFNLQHYPWYRYVYESWRRLRIPLWNPHLNGGQPGLADPQVAALYPPGLLLYALLALLGLPLTTGAMELFIFLHLTLAGYFTYRLTRRITGSWWGGVTAGIIFAFSGYCATFAPIQIPVLQVVTWLPLLLLLLDRAWERRRLLDYGLTGVVFALAILGGHPQWLIYTVYVALFFFLFRTLERGGPWRSHLKVWGGLVGSLAYGVLLSAAQLLPTVELFLHSQRAEELSREFVSAGLPPAQLPGLVLSQGISQPLIFVGAVAVLLAGFGLLTAWRRARIWGAVALAALLIAFGGDTIVYTLLYILLPGFSLVRDQYRIWYVLVLAVAVLAGFGVARLEAEAAGKEPRALAPALRRGALWLLGGAGAGLWLLWLGVNAAPPVQAAALLDALGLLSVVLALFAGVLTLLSRRLAPLPVALGMLVSVLVLELFSPMPHFVLRDAPPEGLFPITPVVATLQAGRAELARVSSEGLLPGGPNSAAVYGLEDVLGYTPLRLQHRVDFEERAGLDELALWGHFNVRYVLTTRDFGDDGRFALLAGEGESRLYGFWGDEHLPRARIVHRAVVVPEAEVWEAVRAHDPRREVVLVAAPPFSLSEGESCESAVTVASHRPNAITLEADAGCEGLLVLSEIDYPGWRAYVNGERVPVLRANGAFRALPLRAGARQRVVLRFVPLSFWGGALLSLLAVLGGGVALRRQSSSSCSAA